MFQVKEIVRNNYVSRKGHINLWHTGQMIAKAILQNHDIRIKKSWSVQIVFLKFPFTLGLTRLEKNMASSPIMASSLDAFCSCDHLYIMAFIHTQRSMPDWNDKFSIVKRDQYDNFPEQLVKRMLMHSLYDMAASWESENSF